MADGFQLASAYVRVVADTSSIGPSVTRSAARAGESGGSEAARGFRGRFTGGLKGVGGQVTALIGGGALLGFLHDSVTGWQDHERVMRQTQAVIKSTSSAAGLTAKQMGALSDSVEANTGVDGDNVLAGENMLATFTNIHDAAGKGNDIFTQATKIMTDMSVATGTDAKNSAIQLGKALNDPVKGIAALSRVGVTFDDAQQKQIKGFVKSGQTAKAQGVILKELNKEFGGSAKAQETSSQKMQVAMHGLEDTVGSALTPVIEKFSTFVSSKVVPGLQSFAQWSGQHLVPVLKEMGSWIQAHIVPALQQMVQWVQTHIVPALQAFGAWFMQHLPQMKAIFMAWFNVMKTEFNSAKTILMTLWHGAFEPLVKWIAAHWSQISTTIRVVFTIAAGIIRTWAAIINWLLKNVVIPVMKGIIQAIRIAITTIVAVVKAFIAVWTVTWNVAKAVINAVRSVISGAASGIRSAINSVKSVVGTIGGAFRSAYNSVKNIVGNIVSAVASIPGRLGGIAGRFGSAGKSLMTSFWNGIKSMAGAVGGVAANLWNSIKGFLNHNFIDKIRGIGFSKWGVSFHPFSGIGQFAQGGPVSGLVLVPQTASLPVYLTVSL